MQSPKAVLMYSPDVQVPMFGLGVRSWCSRGPAASPDCPLLKRREHHLAAIVNKSILPQSTTAAIATHTRRRLQR